MFSRRRPTPSARTVKLLYQLGYIASGTAAGLATLCLEEQRRRIKILQTITDNAKIIRQHPRYRGNIAAAIEAEADEVLPIEDNQRLLVEGIPRARRHGRWQRLDADAHTGNREAPQHHAAAYDRDPYSWYREESMRARAPRARQVEQLAGSASEMRSVAMEAGSQSLRHGADALSTPVGAHQRMAAHDKSRNTINRTLIDSDRTAQSSSLSPSLLKKNEAGASSHLDFPVPDANTSVQSSDMALKQMAEETDALSYTWDIETPLRSAISSGSAEDVRSICRQRITAASLSQADVRVLCDACPILAHKMELSALCELYAMVFDSGAFSSFSESFRLEQIMTVAQSILLQPSSPRSEQLLSEILERSLQHFNIDKVARELGKRCDGLLAENEVSIATALVSTFGKSHKESPAIIASFDSYFEKSIKDARPQDCASVLRWKKESLGIDSIRAQLKPFIHLCESANQHNTLVQFFNSETGLGLSSSLLSEYLGTDDNVILAKAFSTHESHADDFRRLCKSLPRSLWSSLDWLPEISALGETWKATHNLTHIDARVLKLKDQLKENCNAEGLLQFEDTLLEIYPPVEAVDNAHDMVRSLDHSSGANSNNFCRIALAFAKRGEWKGLDQLLSLMKRFIGLKFDDEGTRIFNDVIWTYSRQHEPEETWKLLKRAMQDLAFTPNRMTTENVLQSFIIKGKFELIPQWTAFMQQDGRQFCIDADMTAVLLRSYCVHYRPSHIFVMWLCRKLFSLSPSLRGESVLSVVKQCIGYDLRHLKGQYKERLQQQAEMRLARVTQAKDYVPSPGFVWEDRLYFHEDEEKIGNTPHKPIEGDVNLDDVKALKRYLWLKISLGQHEAVLQLYQRALDTKGMPPSPEILEVTVEASLRLHNGASASAEKMIAQAQKAGMNTFRADGVLFTHYLRRSPPQNLDDVQRIRGFVLEHYREAERNGLPVTHSLATTAAHSLIIRGFVDPGIELLRFIRASSWGKKRSFDIATMAVMLRGYIAQRSIKGIGWVMETVLNEDLRITKHFLEHLKEAERQFKSTGKYRIKEQDQIRQWIRRCNERRLDQMAETRRMGWKLVQNLAKASKEGINVDMQSMDPLEEPFIDGASPENATSNFTDESYFSDEVDHDALISNKRDADFKKRAEQDWNAERDFRRQMKSLQRSSRTAFKAEVADTPVDSHARRTERQEESVGSTACDNTEAVRFVPMPCL